jgi:hypothetical protein
MGNPSSRIGQAAGEVRPPSEPRTAPALSVRAAAVRRQTFHKRSAGRQQFVWLDIGGDGIFDPGASAFVTLVFSQPVNPRVLHVLAGAFA